MAIISRVKLDVMTWTFPMVPVLTFGMMAVLASYQMEEKRKISIINAAKEAERRHLVNLIAK